MDSKENENKSDEREDVLNEEVQNESENQIQNNNSQDLHSSYRVELAEEKSLQEAPKKTPSLLFAVIGIVVVLLLGAVVFGKSIMRVVSPKNYLATVITNSQKNFAPKSLFIPASEKNSDKPIEQNFVLSIDDVSSAYMDSSTEELLNYAKMGSFSVKTVFDKIGKKNLNSFSVKAVGMEIASLDLFFSSDVYALRFPLGYEKYITIDPNTFIKDYNESFYAPITGSMPESVDLNAFTEAIFVDHAGNTSEELTGDDSALSKSTIGFYNSGTLKYLGKEDYENVSTHKYTLTFTAENTKIYYDTLIDEFVKLIKKNNEAAIAFMGEYQQQVRQIKEFEMLMKELGINSDLVADIFVGKNDRILGIKAKVTVDDLGQSNVVESEIKLLGKDYLSNNMDVTLSFSDEGNPMNFHYKREAANTDKVIDESNTFNFTTKDTYTSPISLNYKLKYDSGQVSDNFSFDFNMTDDNYGDEININFNVLGNYTFINEEHNFTDGKISFEIPDTTGRLKFDYNSKPIESTSFELGESKSLFELSIQELMLIGQNIQKLSSYFQ